MEKLKDLYNIRDIEFTDKTYKIFEQIDNTLACITQYLADVNDIIAQGIIAWEDTSLVSDLIVVIGTVQYNVGDVLHFEDDDILITTANIEEYEQIVHMSVPIDLVIENNQDKILEFLYETSVEDYFGVPPNNIDDFDLTELSDDQLNALHQPTSTRDN